MTKSIDVICPVYAEGPAIASFHDRLSSVLNSKSSSYSFKILYVVDPAKDDTETALEKIIERDHRVEVIVMSRRFGHQMALVAGMDNCSGDASIMLDSDLQHPPELILELINAWEEGAEIVQAVREDGEDVAPWKRLTSRWFYKSFMSVGSIELKAGAADYRLLSRRVLELFQRDMREHNPFLRGLVSWVGFNVRYVPFKTAPRFAGTTKYKLTTLFEFAINGVTSFSKLPLRICILMGLAVAAFSGLFGVFTVISAFAFAREVPGWATLTAAVSFLGGVQLLFLGVMGEYIAVIFDEVKDRPRYIIARHLRSGNTSSSVPANHETSLPAQLRQREGDISV